MQENARKMQTTVNLPCSGYNTDKRNILMYLYGIYKGVYELRGKNSACYCRKTNILDFDDDDDKRGWAKQHEGSTSWPILFRD